MASTPSEVIDARDHAAVYSRARRSGLAFGVIAAHPSVDALRVVTDDQLRLDRQLRARINHTRRPKAAASVRQRRHLHRLISTHSAEDEPPVLVIDTQLTFPALRPIRMPFLSVVARHRQDLR